MKVDHLSTCDLAGGRIYNEMDRLAIGRQIARLKLDQAGIDRMLSAVEAAARIHCLRSRVLKIVPTPLELVDFITGQIADIDACYKLVTSRILNTNIGRQEGIYRGNPRLEALLGRVLVRVRQHLEGMLAAIGQPQPQSKNNSSKSNRDLFWEAIVKIWISGGGKETGKQLADFLMLVSVPIEELPSRSAIIGWLSRRAKTKRAGAEQTL
jgi:hypothetical protein